MTLKALSEKMTWKKPQDTGHHQRRRDRFEAQSRADLDRQYGHKTQFGTRNSAKRKSRLFGLGRG